MKPLLTPHQLPPDAIRSVLLEVFDLAADWNELDRFFDELHREGYQLEKVHR